MFNAVPFLHTEPEGNPALDVGIDLIERLLTCNVQLLSAVMFAPIIAEQLNAPMMLFNPNITP